MKKLTIRLPFQPKDSGKYFRGSFNVLCFEFSDELPTRLNNFLWRVRDLPVINWISVFLARGGFVRCFRCNKYLWPNQTLMSEGNVYESLFPTMSHHMKCQMTPDSNERKVKAIKSHALSIYYNPTWFAPGVLDDAWEKDIEGLDGVSSDIKERMKKYPLHKLVAAKLARGRKKAQSH